MTTTTKRNKGGRPRLDGDAKSKMLWVRLTPEQHQLLSDAAKLDAPAPRERVDVSSWVRVTALQIAAGIVDAKGGGQ